MLSASSPIAEPWVSRVFTCLQGATVRGDSIWHTDAYSYVGRNNARTVWRISLRSLLRLGSLA